MNSTGSFAAAILTIASVPALAQWLNVPTKGVPRTKDGKPDLSAPAPRKPDGKPDLSGVWMTPRSSFKYLRDLASDFKPGELPIQAWAEALTKERIAANGSEIPPAGCLPPGIPLSDAGGAVGYPLQLVQQPDLVVVLYEAMGLSRRIYLDGRRLAADPNPTWMGYSTGRWDRDDLVVESTGFNGKMWLDLSGHPTTEALHITERFRRPDFGHLELILTIDDPKAYTKPWSVTEMLELSLDTDLLEYVCEENEKDLNHIVASSSAWWKRRETDSLLRRLNSPAHSRTSRRVRSKLRFIISYEKGLDPHGGRSAWTRHDGLWDDICATIPFAT